MKGELKLIQKNTFLSLEDGGSKDFFSHYLKLIISTRLIIMEEKVYKQILPGEGGE